ncbi:MAG: hypothetical protein ACPHL6_09065 [Rubripirellula sp.]
MTSCAHCGGDIPDSADFCHHCGSSDSDGWSEQALIGDLNPDHEDEFDYDGFVAEEFGTNRLNRTTPRIWRFVAGVLLLLFFLGLVFF